MDFIPTVVDVEHERTNHPDVAAHGREHERVVVALTRGHCIRLRDRVLAYRLQDQITRLLAHVVGVEAWLASAGLTGIEVEPDVVVAIWLGDLRVDGARQFDAGGEQAQAVGVVDVGVGVTTGGR